MIRLILRYFGALLVVAIFFSLAMVRRNRPLVSAEEVAHTPGEKLLIFSKTAGYRHESIKEGNVLLEELGRELGLVPVVTEDAGVFTPQALAGVRLIVFNNTTGDVLNAGQEAAFEAWFRAGGAFVGIHAASDTEYGWPFYAEVLGAQFKNHPKIQTATLRIAEFAHLATEDLPPEWTRKDEWYNFRAPLAPGVTTLIVLDESTYKGGEMGPLHPMAWCQEIHGGRSFYTGLGHTRETYAEPEFRRHLQGGLQWALKRK